MGRLVYKDDSERGNHPEGGRGRGHACGGGRGRGREGEQHYGFPPGGQCRHQGT